MQKRKWERNSIKKYRHKNFHIFPQLNIAGNVFLEIDRESHYNRKIIRKRIIKTIKIHNLL